MSPGLYVAVATRAFRRYSTYRAATLAGIFTNSVFGVIYSYAYLALWAANPDAGGYDAVRRGHLRLARPGAADDRRVWSGGDAPTTSPSGSAPATSRSTSTGRSGSSAGTWRATSAGRRTTC